MQYYYKCRVKLHLLAFIILGYRPQASNVNTIRQSAYTLPEKKRGPPSNKNISVRNMKAHIANMSLNENAGFKSEYHVRYFAVNDLLLISFTFSELLNKYFILDGTKCITRTLQDIPRGELHLCVEGKKPENKVKNRYTTIFPCTYFNQFR